MVNNAYDQLERVFDRWWRTLSDSDQTGERGERANRADAARLRRVGTISTLTGPVVDVELAVTIEAFRDLHRRVRSIGQARPAWEENLVVAAVTLAHIRSGATGRKTAAILRGEPGADRPLMAEPRFLRLMRVRTPADLLDEGRRLAALLKSGAPPGELGASLMLWIDDPGLRRLWAQTYYGLGAPDRPSHPAIEQQTELGEIPS